MNLIKKEGRFSSWVLPNVLYHGTTDFYLESINKEGLSIKSEQKNSALSSPSIYLTTSIEMAKHFAEVVSNRKKSNPIILEINSDELNPDLIGFDLNMSLRNCSQFITYQEKINNFKIIKELKDIKESKMIFDEPKDLSIPMVWNINEQRILNFLMENGFKENKQKKHKI